MKDCNGNISSKLVSEPFVLPEQGDSLDIILNEVLFNSRTGGVDFVELYNRSDKYINLKNWQLANIDNDTIANLKPVSETDYIIQPGSYITLTTQSTILKDQYPRIKTESILVMPSMPTYADDEGSVLLINNLNKLSDRFDYNENFHFSLIDDVEGVSLERINPETATNTLHNWHSAASADGYATPGYRNSQFLSPENLTSAFTIKPQIFTPDEDGQDDFTTFNYAFASHGNTATITIFDMQGREVKKIVRNQLLAAEGFYTWDGTNEKGSKVRTGPYLVYFTLFDMQGKQQIFKERVVLGAEF